MASTEDERWARIKELQGVISKAEAELKALEPPKSFLMELQEVLEVLDVERAAGDDYDTKGRVLGNHLAVGLNMLNDRLQGGVAVHGPNEITVGTDVGDLRWDGDEWFFLERP